MKKLLAIVISMAMVVAMMPMGVFAADGENSETNCDGGCDHVAAIGAMHYDTLKDAVDNVKTNETITLLDNCSGNGISVEGKTGRTFTIDFAGHIYTIVGPTLAGSTGTETQCFQFLKGSTITLKNGSIIADNVGLKMILQNYCNLTLEDMAIDATKGNNSVSYVMSNNCGNVKLQGNTNIIAKDGTKAFDVCWAPNNGYSEGAQVTVETTGTIKGDVEFDLWGTKSESAVLSTLTINSGNFDGNFVVTDLNSEDIAGKVKVNGGAFTDLENAIKYVQNGATIRLLKDASGNGVSVEGKTGRTFTIDFAGHIYTIVGPTLAGSTGTETQCFQFLKGSTITLKNGSIIADNVGLKMILQNYCNLTLEDMAIDATKGNNSVSYVMSNNCGNVKLQGNTNIIAKDGTKAFDVCWAPNNGYSEGAQVTVETTGTIKGDVEFDLWGTKSESAVLSTLTINSGNFDGNFVVTDLNSEDIAGKIAITGGTFSASPMAYIEKDDNNKNKYNVYKLPNGTYVVATNGPSGYTWTAGTANDDYDFIGTAYTPSTPSTPTTDNVTNDTTDKKTTADLTPAVSDNKSTTTVDNDTADKIVDKAVENKSTEVIVDATGNNTVASSEVAIPEKTVKEISEKTDANLVIKTDNGQVDLDRTALAAVAEQAGTTGTVRLVVETVKTDADICHVDLKLVTSNGAVKDFKGGNVKVTINLDKELAAKELVCVYIDDNGIYTLVEGVLNADGTYTFTTGHFSEYAVMAKADADKVIADQLNTLIKEVNLKVRTSKTSKKNIKAVVSGDVKALTDAGYTVKYKFYRSEKKSSKYTAAKVKDTNTYINTVGKKGTKYYYKAKALVYDGDKLVGQTVLKQCKYGVRTWSK